MRNASIIFSALICFGLLASNVIAQEDPDMSFNVKKSDVPDILQLGPKVEKYDVEKIDLNGDGNKEWIVRESGNFGSIKIGLKTGEKWELIFSWEGDPVIQNVKKTKTNGFKDIFLEFRGTGGSGVVLKYDGKKYRVMK